MTDLSINETNQSINQTINLSLEDFDFKLPEHLIAQFPATQRTQSRLLNVKNYQPLTIHDESFTDFLQCIHPQDQLIFNNTKVLQARLYGHKASGGKLEALFERLINTQQGLFQIKASHAPKVGQVISFFKDNLSFEFTVMDKQEQFYQLQSNTLPIYQILETIGYLPLPPYIKHAADNMDAQRYQTVFAKEQGAVAAPTASLHFDEALMQNLHQHCKIDYLTLHVGSGTFLPVRGDITQHKMHEEVYQMHIETIFNIIQTKLNGGRTIAIGTTALRTLETVFKALWNWLEKHTNTVINLIKTEKDWLALQVFLQQMQQQQAEKLTHILQGATHIFIKPPYNFAVVDALLTNFHLPKSTLMMLVGAFVSVQPMHAIYQHAIANNYRFFSYGDAMFCELNKIR